MNIRAQSMRMKMNLTRVEMLCDGLVVNAEARIEVLEGQVKILATALAQMVGTPENMRHIKFDATQATVRKWVTWSEGEE